MLSYFLASSNLIAFATAFRHTKYTTQKPSSIASTSIFFSFYKQKNNWCSYMILQYI